MFHMVNYPSLILVLSVVVMGLAVFIGDYCRERLWPLDETKRSDFVIVQSASLTLLGLLIGFTFSMAVNRYEQRKNYEEDEANAIGTEYVRADLLPEADTPRLHDLLKQYLSQRVDFYTSRDAEQLRRINSASDQLENEMWYLVQSRGTAHPSPMLSLVVSGMNDVLNARGYTQAAWWNRIPTAAWILLIAIAVGCNLLIGYGARRKSTALFMVFPLAVSLSFFLIADIDSPRGGLIRVRPQNLISLSEHLR